MACPRGPAQGRGGPLAGPSGSSRTAATAHFTGVFEPTAMLFARYSVTSSSEPTAAAARGVWRPRTGDCVRKPGLVRASGVLRAVNRPVSVNACGLPPTWAFPGVLAAHGLLVVATPRPPIVAAPLGSCT